MSCTLIFILGQDVSQGSIIEIVDDQGQPPFCLDKGQPRILAKPPWLLYFKPDRIFFPAPMHIKEKNSGMICATSAAAAAV